MGVRHDDHHATGGMGDARVRRAFAAISAAVDVSHAHRLDDIGEELKSSVAALGPKYGLNTREY
jgi:hypothetical protein